MEAILNKIIKDWPPAIVIIIVVVFAYLLLNKDLQIIDKHLTNHVTGTEKKIERLETKIDSNINQLRVDMNAKFDKVDSSFDSLFLLLNKHPKDSDKK